MACHVVQAVEVEAEAHFETELGAVAEVVERHLAVDGGFDGEVVVEVEGVADLDGDADVVLLLRTGLGVGFSRLHDGGLETIGTDDGSTVFIEDRFVVDGQDGGFGAELVERIFKTGTDEDKTYTYTITNAYADDICYAHADSG